MQSRKIQTGPVRVHGNTFRDAENRHMLLRGVNLGGDCKVPWPDGGTNFPSDFSDHRTVSFVGRPFPLSEATAHFTRLSKWGFNCLRLLTTWEAIEHAGPGEYDVEYLDYFTEICRLASEFGLHIFVDFHQDVWSRMTGGDGAPGWTFEAVGLNFRNFHATNTVHVMQYEYDYTSSERRQGSYPQMSWGMNHRLPAASVMWTLFWAGAQLTPDFRYQGVNIQEFLQSSYLGCLDQIAQRVKHMPHVIGFDTLNEPGLGWIGYPMNYRHLAADGINPVAPRIGPALTPIEGIALLRGSTVEVPRLLRNIETGKAEVIGQIRLNESASSAWLPGCGCPFEEAGAYTWADGKAVDIKEDYFQLGQSGPIDVYSDGMGPLFHRVADVIRKHNADWLAFVEIDPFACMSGHGLPGPLPTNSVNAGHWYDVRTLFLKSFEHVEGEAANALRERYVRELGVVESLSNAQPGGMPTLIGEFGIPFDLDDGEAYDAWESGEKSDKIWKSHSSALGFMYDALDARLLNATLWNYTASNRNDLLIGDGWNQEDLSIFSLDQCDDMNDPDSGGRAVHGFCRPYPQHVAGTISRFNFDSDAGFLTLEFESICNKETIIYIPAVHFPGVIKVSVNGPAATWTHDKKTQKLIVVTERDGHCVLTVQRWS